MSSLSPGVCKQNTHLPTTLRGSNLCFRWVAQSDNFHCVFCESQGGRRGLCTEGVLLSGCTRRRRATGMGLGALLSRVSAGPALPGAPWSCLHPQPSRSEAVGTGVEGRPRAGRGWRSAEDKASGVGSWVRTGHGGGRLCPQEMLAGGTRANGQQAAQDSRRLGAVLPSTPMGPEGGAAADHRGHLP